MDMTMIKCFQEMISVHLRTIAGTLVEMDTFGVILSIRKLAMINVP
jgi:hypothetical protein